jgi:protein required for attachment to host cells
MRNTWIVVADAGRALILSAAEKTLDITLVRQLENPKGRAHNVDLVTDQRGRNVSHTGMQSAMEAPTTPHEHEVQVFVHLINLLLDEAASQGAYESLILVAPAHFLGLLSAGLRPTPQKLLAKSLAKDLMRLSLPELQSHLRDSIGLPYATAEQRTA